MNVIPVIDLRHGIVVRGVAGDRKNYRPVESCLTPSHAPLDVSVAFRQYLGLDQIYLADLDAIEGRGRNLDIYRELVQHDFRAIVDAGIREAHEAEELLATGISGVVAGLETLSGPRVLHTLCRQIGSERVVFSLDLHEGKPLGVTNAWSGSDPVSIVADAVAAGVTRVIVLDLSRVGTGGGLGSQSLCQTIRTRFPNVQLIAGGGVRELADLQGLANMGLDGALVASALHNGRLDRDALASLWSEAATEDKSGIKN